MWEYQVNFAKRNPNILLVPVEFRPSYLVPSFSVKSSIFDVELGGGTYKRDSNKQVNSSLRCICVYIWDEKNIHRGLPSGSILWVQCCGSHAMIEPRSWTFPLCVMGKFMGSSWGSPLSNVVGAPWVECVSSFMGRTVHKPQSYEFMFGW